MSDIAIRVEDLGKKYTIGAKQARYQTFRDSLTNAFNQSFRTRKGQKSPDENIIWALKDVNFEVKHGEVLGIIGRNGAGKSTLLKILARITKPTTGRIELNGRVGSLLEVGTGFHPELTGRENIFLNGAILGMMRHEIEKKFDEIVDFAEIEKFLDTSVKHYSSGMYMRLAFAVAAYLDPEILLVDEVLAVGDAEFQKKCLGKMADVAKTGRTVLFVSHNMAAISRLCNTGFVISNGNLIFNGLVNNAINKYVENVEKSLTEINYPDDKNKDIQFSFVKLIDKTGLSSTDLDRSQDFYVIIEYIIKRSIVGVHLSFMLEKVDGTTICHCYDVDNEKNVEFMRNAGKYVTKLKFPGGLLNSGLYQIRLGISRKEGTVFDYCEPFVFQMTDRGNSGSLSFSGSQRPGILALLLDWKTLKVD